MDFHILSNEHNYISIECDKLFSDWIVAERKADLTVRWFTILKPADWQNANAKAYTSNQTIRSYWWKFDLFWGAQINQKKRYAGGLEDS